MKLGVGICSIALSLALAGHGAKAASPAYEFIGPNGVVCTGGDTSGPTILQARMTGIPNYNPTPLETSIYSHLYMGTSCTQRVSGIVSPAELSRGSNGIAADPSTSTSAGSSPYWSCPTTPPFWTGTQYECVGASTAVTVVYSFPNDTYLVSVTLSINESGGCNGRALNSQQDVHDSNGTSFNYVTMLGQCFFNQDGNAFYSFQDSGGANAQYEYSCPDEFQQASGSLIDPFAWIQFFGCLQVMERDTVHGGIRADVNWGAGCPCQTVCWWADLHPLVTDPLVALKYVGWDCPSV
jgi:hypothetical protein